MKNIKIIMPAVCSSVNQKKKHSDIETVLY